ncbi:hypothetical protein BDR06DRAFT_959254 [Suillus hirtellus]|nr:hypothetical protein BDR06DRAFT_959254 [Suillus hirtellus]
MDDYTMFASGYGSVESNLSSFLVSRLEDSYACRLPDFPYTRASSSFSAVVQFYAPSSQLDTAEVRHRHFHDTPPWCHYGCDAFESVHHIFARRLAFLAIRRAHGMQLCDEISSLFEGKAAGHVREALE